MRFQILTIRKGEGQMQSRTRTFITAVTIISSVLLAGNVATAEWTEPICLTELNNYENGSPGYGACISNDGLSIFYIRQVFEIGPGDSYYILEARRNSLDEPFAPGRALTELGNAGNFMTNPWVSRDGLRLYYSEAVWEGSQFTNVLKMAARDNASQAWRPVRTLTELHPIGASEAHLTLTSDESTIIWGSRRPSRNDPGRIFTATRESINSPFSAPVELPELTAAGAGFPHLSGDGLRIYFSADNGISGVLNIYMMSRPSLNEPFGDLKHLDGVTGPGEFEGGAGPHLSPDEKAIYFHGGRGETLDEIGVFVSHWITDPLGDAIENIEAAIEDKNAAIALITETLKKETAALEALNELRDTGENDPVKILQSKMSIFRAIHRQLRARTELKRAIADLEKSLKQLQAPDKPKRNNSRNARAPAGPELKERPRRTR